MVHRVGCGADPHEIAFVKMHGLGNDFVVLDARYGLPFSIEAFAIAACDRHFGMGADGIVALEPSNSADFKIVYANADGSLAICANGIRCLSRYIYARGLLGEGSKNFTLETLRGNVKIEILGSGERIRVDMGEPIFAGPGIPIAQSEEFINQPLVVGDKTYQASAVGMGNPHCVVFLDDVDGLDLLTIGPKFEFHPFFPKRTNAEFVQIIDNTRAKMRVWERGVGETLACGTGACATLAACVRNGLTARRIALDVPGGQFEVFWNEADNHLYLSGPAEEVYSGWVDADRLIRQCEERGGG